MASRPYHLYDTAINALIISAGMQHQGCGYPPERTVRYGWVGVAQVARLG